MRNVAQHDTFGRGLKFEKVQNPKNRLQGGGQKTLRTPQKMGVAARDLGVTAHNSPPNALIKHIHLTPQRLSTPKKILPNVDFGRGGGHRCRDYRGTTQRELFLK
jgi:hypothetical protein